MKIAFILSLTIVAGLIIYTEGKKSIISIKNFFINQTKIIMQKAEEIQQLIGEINDSTNNIAADLERLAEQADGGLSAEEADSFIAQLRSSSTALKAVAAVNPEPDISSSKGQ